ncbi:DUF928 domain-containing protein [Oscillatoria sp. FACHB-1406]|uniref:DUF928 domain-containing protein n=1 Tax=Oscillatoria sp. FACHB-1406 TaxID=2692846 RepID=UPI00168569F4|nr:DUF928 domain-containing protein [Oscillatoria sp. FACHB-1406]MBD2578909.1 DUF928 domain-containing protein [Oscillatoria sp. FACHB-1406]
MKFFNAKFSLHKKILALALLGAIAASLPLAANSQTLSERSRDSIDTIQPIVFATPDLSGRGRPGDRRGGASRGICPRHGRARDLVAFIPDTSSNPSIGLTTEAHPTFWFHVPYAAKDFSNLSFTLQDEEDNPIYTTQLTGLSNLPGIVSFQLPANAPSLTPGTTYRWVVSPSCEEGRSGNDEFSARVAVGGSVVRVAVDPEIDRELKEARTPRERALIYARNGFWYDTFTEIGNLRRAGEAGDDWEQLLDSLDLEEFAKRPLVDCCQGNN